MEKQQQSEGSVKMKRIKTAYNAYAMRQRAADQSLARLKRLITLFPKKERPLYEEQLQKYLSKIE